MPSLTVSIVITPLKHLDGIIFDFSTKDAGAIPFLHVKQFYEKIYIAISGFYKHWF